MVASHRDAWKVKPNVVAFVAFSRNAWWYCCRI